MQTYVDVLFLVIVTAQQVSLYKLQNRVTKLEGTR